MGSPWPWPQTPVSTTNGSSVQNSNNNNKRPNYGYNGYDQNLHNNDFHHQTTPAHHHNHHLLQNSNQHRFIPQSPTSPVVVPSADPIISGELVSRKRSSTHNSPYFSYEMQLPHQHHQSHHSHHQLRNNNNNESFRKPQSPISPSTSTYQSQFVTSLSKIPTWNIYYSDQRHRMIDFTVKENSIRPNASINQLVSLCFLDTCITNLAVDAIVNSTTEDYRGNSGVDKHIHEVAGKRLREACKSLPKLGIGQAEMTPGCSLPAKHVIHTNGPLTEDAEQELRGCYVNSLNLLLINRLRTIAFPCISTGGKGLPRKFAVEIALSTVRQFLEEHKQDVDRIIFCLHHQKDTEIYLRYMQIYFPVEEQDFRIPIT